MAIDEPSIFTSLEVSEAASLGSKEQLDNNIRQATKKWFSLSNNELDGSYRVLPEELTPDIERGWWGTQLSNDTGGFGIPPTITGRFKAQPLFAYSLIGDALSGCYPTAIRATYYGENDTILKQEVITSSEPKINRLVNLPLATGIKIEILSISRANAEVRIVEFDVLVEENYISELMDDPNRRIHCRVTLNYLNPFSTYTSTLTSENTANWTSTEQLSNNVTLPSAKWFSLTNNKLDGSYSPIPADDSEVEVGWWSNVVSNKEGIFEVPPVVVITLTPQPVLGLTIVGDDRVKNYPVDFNIKLHDKSGNIIVDEIRDNHNISFVKRYIEQEIDSVEVEFLKVSIPNDQLRLVEVKTTFEEVYEDDKLFVVNIDEEDNYANTTLPNGSVIASGVDVEVSDERHEFDITRPDCPYRGLLLKNRRIKIEFGLDMFPGYTKWYPYGTFYSTRWNVQPSSLSVAVSGLDLLSLLDQEQYLTSTVQTNISLYDAFEQIIKAYTLLDIKYNISEEYKQIKIPYLWFLPMSFREALTQLAKVTTAVIYVDRQDTLQILKPSITEYNRYNFRNHTTIFDRTFPSAWSEGINRITVSGRMYTPVNVDNVFTEKTQIRVPANATETISVKSPKIPILSMDTFALPSTLEVLQYIKTCWGVYLKVRNTTNSEVLYNIPITKGVALEETQTIEVHTDNEKAQLINGIREEKTSSDYIQTMEHAQLFAQNLLQVASSNELDLLLDSRGHIDLHLQERIGVEDVTGKYLADYVVTSLNTYWNGGFSCKVKGKTVEGVI